MRFHNEIAVRVLVNALDGLTGVRGEDFFEKVTHTQDFLGCQLEISDLAVAHLAIWLVEENSTVRQGQAASAAAVLLAAGTKGKRLALPHSRILLHQPYGQVGYGQVTDLELAAKEILRMRDLLEEILSKHTGQTIERVHQDTDRDFVMEAQEALTYGIIDDVISSRDAVDRTGPIR